MSDNSSNENEDEHSSSSPTTSDVLNSPITTLPNDFRTALDEFRANWQKELQHLSETEATVQFEDTLQTNETIECLSPLANVKDIPENEQHMLAESLFHKAVELEQRGKVYDALPFYRKAVQIVPDIEFKFYERQKLKAANGEVTTKQQSSVENSETEHDFDAEEIIADLYEKFQMDLARDCGGKLLLSSRDLNVITTEMHISDLPPEILLYILRWVISAQLDMRSLEHCAGVCKGFYLCARDEELWRLACVKVWGVNVGTLNNPAAEIEIDDTMEHILPLPQYTSWRQMFIERERLLFNGCYISKTKYLRMGENSFQDQFYRPVQLVAYFRYIRFLPDGTVLMMTTADEPVQGVTRLRNINQSRPDILRGHYQLYGNTVTIILKRQQPRIIPTGHQYARHRRGSSVCNEDYNSTKYCMEFRIVSTPKRKFSQIAWLRYAVTVTRNKFETNSEFDLTPSKYPPLWFSPVRSYHLDADAPLA